MSKVFYSPKNMRARSQNGTEFSTFLNLQDKKAPPLQITEKSLPQDYVTLMESYMEDYPPLNYSYQIVDTKWMDLPEAIRKQIDPANYGKDTSRTYWGGFLDGKPVALVFADAVKADAKVFDLKEDEAIALAGMQAVVTRTFDERKINNNNQRKSDIQTLITQANPRLGYLKIFPSLATPLNMLDASTALHADRALASTLRILLQLKVLTGSDTDSPKQDFITRFNEYVSKAVSGAAEHEGFKIPEDLPKILTSQFKLKTAKGFIAELAQASTSIRMGQAGMLENLAQAYAESLR